MRKNIVRAKSTNFNLIIRRRKIMKILNFIFPTLCFFIMTFSISSIDDLSTLEKNEKLYKISMRNGSVASVEWVYALERNRISADILRH
jgi:hypothetical protein